MGTSLVGSCRPHASPPSLAGPYPGQGAWGWAQSPAIRLLLPSLNPINLPTPLSWEWTF